MNMRLVTAAQMRQIEQNAGEEGIKERQLMENAGNAAAAFIKQAFDIHGKNCMVFCGKGNNGGDGLLVARRLFESGANVIVVLADGLPRSMPAMQMYDLLKELRLAVFDAQRDYEKVAAYLPTADLIVDAVYGTGFHGTLDEWHRKLCKLINTAVCAVLSLDLPSGVNADTGFADPDAVNADFTVAFDSFKPAHFSRPGSRRCGRIERLDIGIPSRCREKVAESQFLIDDDMVFSFLPKRSPDSHKGNFGKLLNVCGSFGMSGAAYLSSAAALRCGTGLVTLATTGRLCTALIPKLIESTMLPLPENAAGTLAAAAAAPICERMKNSSALLVGCGLGKNEDTAQVVRQILMQSEVPVVLDADGINLAAENIDILNAHRCKLILTPHPAEMARLSGLTVEQVEQNRIETALAFAAGYHCTVVLKGSATVIATPDEQLYINITGNAGLAKGGSGDVLAGMIAGFAAQGLAPAQSAVCGVYLHGAAADRCAARLSQTAMLPSDLFDDLAAILLEHDR